jgi:TolB protein
MFFAKRFYTIFSVRFSQFFSAALIYSLSQFIPSEVLAQTDIFVRGSGKLIPISLPHLCLEQGQTSAAKDIPAIIQRDLDLSGYFRVIDPQNYIESTSKCGGPESIVYSDWSILGTEGVVRGKVSFDGEFIRAQLYLHDVGKQLVVLGKEYQGDASQITKIAHKFANEIMKFFTGEYGVFGTQIAFSSRVGRFKELFVMDMDGSNLKQLTNDRSLSISSAWDPSGKRLVFTSFRNRQPDLFTIDLSTGKSKQVTNNLGLDIGGKFSADGNSIVSSISPNYNSEIALLSLNGAILKHLTPASRGIDVSPDYSPDYSQIVYCSDMAGGPQIYVMPSGGGAPKRISFVRSNYCTSPAWSPKGDRIAFVCRGDGGFQLFTSAPDGSDPRQLTTGGDNEDPTWSPDGRYIAFSTTQGKGSGTSIALMRDDGSNFQQITSSRMGDSEPSWGPRVE